MPKNMRFAGCCHLWDRNCWFYIFKARNLFNITFDNYRQHGCGLMAIITIFGF